MTKIKVAIYEDNSGLREVLATIIRTSENFELAGEFSNCLDCVKNTEVYRPNVILMDIDLPGKSGIDGVRELKPIFPEVEIIMNTVFDDDDRIFEAIKAGATGYLLKNNSLNNLIKNIIEVHNGGAPMSPSIARKVLRIPTETSSIKNQNFNLTEKEIGVLNALAKGLSYKMVASDQLMSIDTVRTHIKKIYEKLQVHSVTEAVHKVYINKK